MAALVIMLEYNVTYIIVPRAQPGRLGDRGRYSGYELPFNLNTVCNICDRCEFGVDRAARPAQQEYKYLQVFNGCSIRGGCGIAKLHHKVTR